MKFLVFLLTTTLLTSNQVKANTELPPKNNAQHSVKTSLPASKPNNVLLFEVSPKQCTTLEQGQECYLQLTVEWQVTATMPAKQICLKLNEAELQCWQQQHFGSYQQEIDIRQDAQVSLWQQDDPSPMASAQINYAWVYQKRLNKSNLWRMF